jgi:hypothetical protein
MEFSFSFSLVFVVISKYPNNDGVTKIVNAYMQTISVFCLPTQTNENDVLLNHFCSYIFLKCIYELSGRKPEPL